MIAVISQPRYLPFAGYLHRIHVCDTFVYLDHIQYTPRDWENRNKIKTAQGWMWLTVPVRAAYRALIPDVTVNNNTAWGEKHWKSIQTNYGRAPYFSQYAEAYRELLVGRTWNNLTDLNIATTDQLCEDIGIKKPRFVRSSALSLTQQGSALILEIAQVVEATIYLSGELGRNYLDEAAFTTAGISLEYHDYQHPVYPQQHGTFLPYMSAIDLLFNCGPDSLTVLTQT